MSKYGVQYQSGSKKALLDIEKMATPHLCNAWRKVRDVMLKKDIMDDELYLAMTAELGDRGGRYQGPPDDRWTFPEKDAGAGASAPTVGEDKAPASRYNDPSGDDYRVGS